MWDTLSGSLLQNVAFLLQNKICEKVRLMGLQRKKKEEDAETWQIWIKIDYRATRVAASASRRIIHQRMRVLRRVHFAFATCHRIYRVFTILQADDNCTLPPPSSPIIHVRYSLFSARVLFTRIGAHMTVMLEYVWSPMITYDHLWSPCEVRCNL